MLYVLFSFPGCAPETPASADVPVDVPEFAPSRRYDSDEPVLVEDTCGFWTEGVQEALPIGGALAFHPDGVGAWMVDDGNFEVGCTVTDRELTCQAAVRVFPQGGADATVIQAKTLSGTFDDEGVLLTTVTWEVYCTGEACWMMQSSRPIPCLQEIDVDYMPRP